MSLGKSGPSSGAQSVGVVALLLLAAVASVAIQGFAFPTANNSYHIPIVLDYFDSPEGPHDDFHAKLGNFVSYFWIVISWVASEENLKENFLAVHIASRFFFFGAVYLVLRDLEVRQSTAAILAAMTGFLGLFSEGSLVARNEILPAGLTHTGVVVPVVLLSWHCLLQRRWTASALTLGLAFNVNAFVSIWSVAAQTFVMWRWFGVTQWRRFLVAGAVSTTAFLAIAWPTLIWMAKVVLEATDASPFSYQAFIRAYFPYHNLIDMQIGRAAIEASLFAATWALCVTICLQRKREYFLALTNIYWALLFILLFGCLLPYLVDSRLLDNLYPLRMDSYLYILTGILVLAWAAYAWAGQNERLSRQGSALAVVGLFCANVAMLAGAIGVTNRETGPSNTRVRYVVAAALLTLCAALVFEDTGPLTYTGEYPRLRFLVSALAIGVVFGGRPAALAEMCLFVGIGVAALATATSGASVIARVGLATPILAMAVVVLRPAWAGIATVLAWPTLVGGLVLTMSLQRAAVTLVLAFLCCAAGYASRVWFERSAACRPSVAIRLGVLAAICTVLGAIGVLFNGGIAPQSKMAEDWMAAQRWARTNTAPDTLFLALTDNHLSSFATFSRRPSWFDSKLGATVMWAPEFYPTWAYRSEATRRITSWVDICKLAASEDAGYIVVAVQRARDLGAPIREAVYANDNFLIFRVSR
ncbi:MAG: hypothetical protein IT563_18245 [Alphaproteobacteria bacterium]|nr:hypothetical protein [Alphaproteobacteria bacterium]